MTPRLGTHHVPACRRTPTTTAVCRVLIQVPRVRPRPVRVRKRRLKRSVRLGGTLLLAGCPLTWFGLSWIGIPGHATTSSAPPRPPVVVLSPELEPAQGNPGWEVEAPVVLPAGYLLPDLVDEPQEGSVHAGS